MIPLRRPHAVALVALMLLLFVAACDEDDDGVADDIATTPAAGVADDATTAVPAEDNEATPEPTPEPTAEPHAEAVVSAHELATNAGIEVLEAGGTAADAAVAVAAALSVVEPWYSSVLGGGTWALYYDAESEEMTSLNGVGPTGSLATVEDFAARAGQSGIHQANVPGAWDGWMLWLMEYGELDLGQVLAPAIRLAREGYPVSLEMADWLGRSAILSRPSTAAIYAPDGAVVQLGDIVYQHDMADTFESLIAAYDAQDGREAGLQAARDYFYRGPLAEAIVRVSDELGGYLTLEDFEGFEAEIVEPIAIEWNDEITVFQNPPNSQGITMLIALNILRGFNLGDLGPDHPDAVHLQAEALKLALADRHHHVGDPNRVDVPVEQLLSDEHAQRQRDRIDMGFAMRWPVEDALTDPDTGDTTTFHVVDRYGNAAAVTTSLGAQFFVVGDTGIHINNRMRFLALADGDPNQLEPGYRVRHTSNPYIAMRDGRPYILGGNTGADVQAQAQLQQFLNIVEFGMTAQEAVDRPRFVSTAFPATTYPHGAPNTLRVEPEFSADVLAELTARGHAIADVTIAGTGNVIVIHAPDEIEFGAEPRYEAASGTVIEVGQ